jgi:PAS domain S-box-containing protein
MAVPTIRPTGVERTFDPSEIIVTKTDAKGIITYANHVFMRVSGYTEADLVGQPHNCVRHPDMPRAVFQILWDTIAEGREIFAYVVNLCKNGDHYWVLAHVTPTFDDRNQIIGFHSNRRVADAAALAKIVPLYRELSAIERGYDNRKRGIEASRAQLASKLRDANMTYDEFAWSL